MRVEGVVLWWGVFILCWQIEWPAAVGSTADAGVPTAVGSFLITWPLLAASAHE